MSPTSPAPGPRPARPLLTLELVRTEQVAARMIRLVLGGAPAAGFVDNGYTDRYVKLVVPRPGVEYPEPFSQETIQAALPRDRWPAIRTYTVRRVDPVVGELWIDVFQHAGGIASEWASSLAPGDPVRLRGPGGAYVPRDDAAWHLLAGDESALPAIASSLEAMPPGVEVTALVEVDGPEDHVELATPGRLDLRWLHRRDGDPSFSAAVRKLAPRPGVQAFIHGELDQIRPLRPLLRDIWLVPDAAVSLSGYWRRGKDEDSFQVEKRAEAAHAAPR